MKTTIQDLVRWAVECLRTPDGAALVEALKANKLLLTVLKSQVHELTLTPPLAEEYARDQARINAIKQTAAELTGLNGEHVRVIKGARYASLYGDCERYQADLDLLAENESAFLATSRKLMRRGFLQKSGHAITISGKRFASAVFYEPDAAGLPWFGSQFVELHLHGFPITPLSYLDMSAPEFLQLQPLAQDILNILAEFAYRDGHTKQFILRDAVDTILLFSSFPHAELAPLNQAITNNQLWNVASLLKEYLATFDKLIIPPALASFLEPIATRLPGSSYSLFENQAWPFLAARGMSRGDYDRVHEVYAELNDASWQEHFSEFDVGIEFCRGVPIPMRIIKEVEHSSLLRGCEFLVGAKSNRHVVNNRIGAYGINKAPT